MNVLGREDFLRMVEDADRGEPMWHRHVPNDHERARIWTEVAQRRATRLEGAVEDFREIDRLLVQATIELPSERAVTIERAIAVARRHLGGQ